MLTHTEVAHVARLARLDLTPDDMETLRRQLSGVLEHINRLNEVDTSAIPPTAQIFPLQDVVREDVPRAACPREAMLANAPAVVDDLFQVPAVLETEG